LSISHIPLLFSVFVSAFVRKVYSILVCQLSVTVLFIALFLFVYACFQCYYPRDAVLARLLAIRPCVCPSVSVCLSQVGVLSKRLNESSWFLGMGASFPHILHSVIRKFGYLQKYENFVPNSGLRKFCFSMSIVETCCQLSLKIPDQLDRRRSTNLTIAYDRRRPTASLTR